MIIPHTALAETTLIALIEEFATRDGTDYGAAEVSLSEKVGQIRAMLGQGRIVITYDPETQSCSLQPADS